MDGMCILGTRPAPSEGDTVAVNAIIAYLFLLVFSGVDDPVPGGSVFQLSVNGRVQQSHMLAFTADPGESITLSSQGNLSWSIPSLGLSSEGPDISFVLPRRHGIYTVVASDSVSLQRWSILVPLGSEQVRTATINSFPLASTAMAPRGTTFLKGVSSNSGLKTTTQGFPPTSPSPICCVIPRGTGPSTWCWTWKWYTNWK